MFEILIIKYYLVLVKAASKVLVAWNFQKSPSYISTNTFFYCNIFTFLAHYGVLYLLHNALQQGSRQRAYLPTYIVFWYIYRAAGLFKLAWAPNWKMSEKNIILKAEWIIIRRRFFGAILLACLLLYSMHNFAVPFNE